MRKLLILAAFLLMLMASPAWATVTLVHHGIFTYTSGSTSNPVTITAPTAANFLVVKVGCFASSTVTVTSVTHGAANLTQAASARGTNSSGSGSFTDIWYGVSGNTGTTVTVNLSGTTCPGTIAVDEWSTNQSSISFAAAAGTTNLAATQTPIGLGASIANANGFMEAQDQQANQSCTGTLINGGSTYAEEDTINGMCSASLLNVAAASYAPKFQLSVGTDATVSISNAAFNEVTAVGNGSVAGGKSVFGRGAGTPPITRVQSAQLLCPSGTACASGTLSATGSGNFIIVGISTGGTPAATPVTDSAGSTYALCSGLATNPIYYYCTFNATAGATTVTFHTTGSTFTEGIVAEYSGGLTALDQSLQNIATATSYTSNTVTTTTGRELLIGMEQSNNLANTFTATGSWAIVNQVNDVGDAKAFGISEQIVSTTQTNIANTGTCTSAQIIAAILTFK